MTDRVRKDALANANASWHGRPFRFSTSGILARVEPRGYDNISHKKTITLVIVRDKDGCELLQGCFVQEVMPTIGERIYKGPGGIYFNEGKSKIEGYGWATSQLNINQYQRMRDAAKARRAAKSNA